MGDKTPHSEPIPAPKAKRPHNIYAAPGKPGSLQAQMGLEDDLTTFAKLMWLIRHVAARHLDLTVNHNRQDPALLAKVKDDILSQSSILRDDYVDAWPIDSYLRMSLKSHVSTGVRSSKSKNMHPDERCYKMRKRYTRAQGQVRHSPRLASQSSNPPPSTPQVEGAYCEVRRAVQPSQTEREHPNEEDDSAGNHAGLATAADSDPYAVDLDLRTAAAGSSANQRPTTTEEQLDRPVEHCWPVDCVQASLCARSPNDPATASAALSFIAALGAVPIGDVPCIAPLQPLSLGAFSGILAAAPAPAPAQTKSIPDTLLAYALPPTDATRIARVLASLGIRDVGYLRVLAGMRSRDVWLQELRAKGQLSEIELRVLQEILGGLLAEGAV
ncbi:hypothetical protein ACG7TL_005610 [Trametes sanguinea]